MATLQTVSATLASAEQPGRYVFPVSTKRYEILLDVSSNPATLVARKSTASTRDDWATVGTGPANVAVANTLGTSFTPYTCCTDGTIIYAFYEDNDTGMIVCTPFDTGSDTWGSQSTGTAPTSGNTVGLTSNNSRTGQWACGFRPVGSTIALVTNSGFGFTDNVISHSFCSFAIYTPGSDSWGSWVDLDFTDFTDDPNFYTEWDQVVCGLSIASNDDVLVYMQQITRKGSGAIQTVAYTADDTFTVPADCTLIDYQLQGAGGAGGGGEVINSPGYGGGSGAREIRTGVVVTPGDPLPVVIGLGGANDTTTGAGANGGSSTFNGVTANGGSGGDTASAGTGPTATSGFNGADGGAPNAAGGGGAGAPTAMADGTNGSDGTPGLPPIGGTGGVLGGGKGGDSDPIHPGNSQGASGSSAGAAGGGWGLNGSVGTTAGDGANGELIITYIPNRQDQPGRLWQQTIKGTDDSLGTLTEIASGTFPIQLYNMQPMPCAFDAICMADDTQCFVMTGVTGTGRGNVSVGRGANAIPVSFSFTSVAIANSGSEIECSPTLIESTGAILVLGYILSTSVGGTASFNYATSSGGAFSSSTTLGTASAPYQFSRIQMLSVSGSVEITFGTPFVAVTLISSPE